VQPPGHAEPRLLSDDIRRTALVQLRASERERKQAEIGHVSPAQLDDHQTRLFGAELLDLSRVVRRRGSPAHQRALLRVATNCLHLHWPLSRTGASKLAPLRCIPCGTSLSPAHLTSCLARAAMRFRAELQSAVFALLRSDPCTARWLRDHRGLSVGHLLRRLFPPPPPPHAPEERVHLARLLCGAFPSRSVPTAIRSLGFSSVGAGRALLESLRLLCLQRVDAFYGGLKEAAAAAPLPP
jgi:hypothetical protein